MSYLPKIINGNLNVVYCFAEPNMRFDFLNLTTQVRIENQKYILSGKKIFVLGGVKADFILVPAKDQNNEIYVFLINKGNSSILLDEYFSIDDIDTVDIEFDNCELDSNNLLIKTSHSNYQNKMIEIIDYLILGCCSEALGIIEKIYTLTLEYVKTREQFGSKIGSFQVIQHRMVDMYVKKRR